MANAEVMIVPEISKKDLKQSMKELSNAMKKTAKKSGDYFSKSLRKAGDEGSKSIAKSMKGKLGAAAVVSVVAGALLKGFEVAKNQVALNEQNIVGVFGERDATTALNFGRGQGFSEEQTAAFNSRVGRAGGDDQTGRDFIVDTSEFIAQARAGENDLLKNFTQFKGADQFNAIISSLAGRETDDINKFLADIGWAGDADVIFNMLAEIGDRRGKDAFEYASQITKEDERRAELLKKEAKLEKEFAQITREANINIKSGFLENVDSETLSLYKQGLELQAKEQLNAAVNYKENKAIVAAYEEKQQQLDELMLEFFKWILSLKEPITKSFKYLGSLFAKSDKTQSDVNQDTIKKLEKTGLTVTTVNNKNVKNSGNTFDGYTGDTQ